MPTWDPQETLKGHRFVMCVIGGSCTGKTWFVDHLTKDMDDVDVIECPANHHTGGNSESVIYICKHVYSLPKNVDFTHVVLFDPPSIGTLNFLRNKWSVADMFRALEVLTVKYEGVVVDVVQRSVSNYRVLTTDAGPLGGAAEAVV